MDYDVGGPPPCCNDCKPQKPWLPDTSANADQQIAGMIILGSLIGSFCKWIFGLLSSATAPVAPMGQVATETLEPLTPEQSKEVEQELKSLQSNLKTVTFAEEAKLQWESIEKIFRLKPQHKKPFAVIAIVMAICAAPVAFLAYPVIALAIFAGAKKREAEINKETQEKIAKLNT